MFARGLLSLHTPPLLGRKPSSVKSRVSISSKLIEIKGLHLHYFGHLRKTGGRGSYRLVHTTHDLVRISSPLAPVLPTLARLSGKSNHSRTYGMPGGGGCTGSLVIPIRRASKLFVSPTYAKTGGHAPVENVGAPTFLIFPHIFRTFLALSAVRRVARQSPVRRSFSGGGSTPGPPFQKKEVTIAR